MADVSQEKTGDPLREALEAIAQMRTDTDDKMNRFTLAAAITLARKALSAPSTAPVGWFNPWNEYHGYQQVAKEYEGHPETIPLYAFPPSAVPEGWKLVPIEPTEAMVNRGTGAKDGPDAGPDPDYDEDVRLIWSAMLAAAPSPQGDAP